MADDDDGDLIGRELYCAAPFPWFGSLLLLAGGALLAGGMIAENDHLSILSAMPLTVAVVLIATRPSAVQVRFEDEELVLLPDQVPVPYGDVERLTVNGVPRFPGEAKLSGVVQIVTADIRIALAIANRSVIRQVHAFLHERIPCETSRPFGGELEKFHTQQVEQFGEGRVFAYLARSPGAMKARGPWKLVGPAMMLVGVGWGFAPLLGRDYEGWIGGAIVAFLVGLITWLIQVAIRNPAPRGIRNVERASLVIAPVGIALSQGDAKGKLRWDELTDIQMNGRPRHLAVSNSPPGICLTVPGADILVVDVYDRPLSTIYGRMLHYWREPE